MASYGLQTLKTIRRPDCEDAFDDKASEKSGGPFFSGCMMEIGCGLFTPLFGPPCWIFVVSRPPTPSGGHPLSRHPREPVPSLHTQQHLSLLRALSKPGRGSGGSCVPRSEKLREGGGWGLGFFFLLHLWDFLCQIHNVLLSLMKLGESGHLEG